DPLSTGHTSKPSAPRGGEVDPGEQGGERRAVDRHLRGRRVERGQLETSRLEALRQDTPSGAVEPHGLGDAPPLVEEEVEVAVGGIEPEAAHRAREGVERAAHVEGRDDYEHADGWREGQHALRTSRRRRSVWSSKSSPTSIVPSPTRTTYLCGGRGVEDVRTSSTSRGSLCSGADEPRLERFRCHARSERPSTPWLFAHERSVSPDWATDDRHARASFSSTIFRNSDIAHLRERSLRADCPRVTPVSLMGHGSTTTSA